MPVESQVPRWMDCILRSALLLHFCSIIFARQETKRPRSGHLVSPERITRKSESAKHGCCDSSMILEYNRQITRPA